MKKGAQKRIVAVGLSAILAWNSFPVGMKALAEKSASAVWLPQREMKVESFVSEDPYSPVGNILDGDLNTMWSSDWTKSDWEGEKFPEEAFTINLGEVKENVAKIKYTPRQNDINGKVKKYQILAGEEKDSMHVVAGGYWEFSDTDRNDNCEKTATFQSTDAQYITLKVFDTTININAGETKYTISCAEFNVGCQENMSSYQQKLEELLKEAENRITESNDEDYKKHLQRVVNHTKDAIADLEVLANEDAQAYIKDLEKAISGDIEIKAKAVYVPSEAGGTEKEKMYDGDKSTFFETNWTNSDLLFQSGDYLVFDFGKTVNNLAQILYTPRQDSENGRIVKHKIWVSDENLEELQITGTQQFLEEHFEYQATGVWDKTVADKTSTFVPMKGRYLALQVFNVGGDGNTITCAEIGFKKGIDKEIDQGKIAQLSEELKELRDQIGKPAVEEAISEKLSEIEGQIFTKEGVEQIEKELQEMIKTYSSIGNVAEIESGKVWLDTDGEVIQAHSGNINYDQKTKTYYWYGDHKGADNIPTGATTGNPAVGVGCYSSKDLYNWTNEGVVFPVFNNPQLVDGSEPNDDYPMYLSEQTKEYKESPLQEFPGKTTENGKPVVSKAPFETLSKYSDDEFIEKANKLYEDLTYEEKQELYYNFNWNKVVERPKVIFNEKTEKYVMWWHQDGPAVGQYTDAMAGVAISDSATGPFKFIGTKRLLPDNPQKTGMLRDMNLFVDDDGTGYLIYASEENATTIIHKLNEEYTDVSGTVEGKDYVKIFVGNYREAPAVFREGNTYYLVTSGQTGWNPNPCKYSYTEGELLSTNWSENKTFCINDYDLSGQIVTNPERGTTFHSQSTWILPNRDDEGNKIPGQYVYIGDRWFPNDLKDSRYIWLPLNFDAQKKTISMEWKDSWSFEEVFEEPIHSADKSDLAALITYAKSQQESEDYQYVVPVVKEKFESTLAEAETVNADDAATQEVVDAAYDNLLQMVQYLAFTGNTSDLKVLVDIAKGLNEKIYTTESWKPFVVALKAAEKVLSDENALQEEIDAVRTALQSAMDALQKKTVDKTDLEGLVNKAETKYESKLDEYTSKTAEIFQSTLDTARVVLADENVTQKEVDEAYANLQQAIFGLRLIPNKDKLEDLISKVENVDLNMYTAETAEAVRRALGDAQAVFADPDATQTEIDGVVKRLQASVDGLKDTAIKQDKLNNNKTGNTDDKKQEALNKNENSVKTGDATSPIGWGVAVGVTLAVVFFARRKK